jgi:hypothetical protein
MVRKARFGTQPLPLSNLVVEANEAMIYAKRKYRAPNPPAGVQLSFPLSFEAGQTWTPQSRFYRVQVIRERWLTQYGCGDERDEVGVGVIV